MTPERWQRVKVLFNQAMEREPAARAAFIAEQRGDDLEVRREVESLLATLDEADDPFERPVSELAANLLREQSVETMVGQHVGPYRLVREIGWGGMGTVYEAERADETYRKRVALKVVRREMASEAIVRRFRNERQILAGLDHPNIAGLLDGGVTADGRPFFAMEYVEGQPIDEYCRARRLPLDDRIAIFLDVCAAVQCAHRSLVIHRDLKPSNILVTESGKPKLLDFGIAKLLGEGGEPGGAHLTRAGDFLFTPDYACPEHVHGGPITTASDVYSLGIVLYELLAGTRPHRLEGRPLQEIVRAITEEDPMLPSAAVTRADDFASADGGGARLRRRLAGDLDSIVLKAIRKEPGQRYSSVEQLSEDLRRYLDGRPVLARADTALYRIGKFARRHAAAVAAVGLLITTLAGGIVATLSQARRAEAERARAEERFEDLRGLANAMLFEIHDSIAELPGATPTRELLVRRGVQYLDRLSRQTDGDSSLEREVAAAYIRLGGVQGQPTAANLGDLNAARASYLRALSISERLLTRDDSDREARRTLALAHEKLGDVDAWSGTARAGVAHAREALQAWQRLSEANTTSAPAMLPVAISHIKLGDVLGNPSFTNIGDHSGAMAQYQSALAIVNALPPGGADDARVRRYIGLIHERIGEMYMLERRYGEAISSFEKSFAMRQALAAENQTSGNALRDVGVAHEKICSVHLARGETGAALSRCRQALEVYESLHAADPRDVQAATTVAIGHRWVYRALLAGGDLRGALAELVRSTELLGRLLEIPGGHHVSARREYAHGLLHLGMLHARLSTQPGAAPSQRQQHRNDSISYHQRGRDLLQALRADGALTAADENLLREADALHAMTKS